MAPAAIEQPVSAKEEIAEYMVPTRFGKDKPPVKLDKPIPRPASRGEAIRQIEETYRFNDWKERDEKVNSLEVGLDAKPVGGYSNEELKIILDDFERRGMIIYEK